MVHLTRSLLHRLLLILKPLFNNVNTEFPMPHLALSQRWQCSRHSTQPGVEGKTPHGLRTLLSLALGTRKEKQASL